MKKISQRQIKVISDSPLFAEEWYCKTYPDVVKSGMSPVEHYLRLGALFGRDPGPNFCTRAYLSDHQDVAKHDMNPLYHYETHGRREKRKLSARPSNGPDPAILASRIDPRRPAVSDAAAFLSEVFSRKMDHKPKRLFPSIDLELTRQVTDCLASLEKIELAAMDLRATVVMPTYNRADKLKRAITSVLEQSHAKFELIVIDDGSSDATPEVLKDYENKPNVRVFWNHHGGVSKARNTGLENATGDVIFYLDSDNVWTRDFVRLMLHCMCLTQAECAYGASKIENARGETIGYRGEPFDWDYCLNGNYVDMNVFCHRKNLISEKGMFDVTLKRMVDWDLILRYTKQAGAVYCPVIGCVYAEDDTDANRISISQPYAFRKIVHEKNANNHPTSVEALRAVSLNIAIKIPAPFEKRAAWGDYHYAESLKTALAKLGHHVRIDFLGTWYDRQVNADDLAIVIRGLTAYKPRPGQLSMIWNISHPDQISYDEYKSYHGIFIASDSYAALLSKLLERDVRSLLQCADSSRFSFDPANLALSSKGVFVGNSRKIYRDAVKWSVDNKVDINVFGQHWEEFIPSEMIGGENIANTELHKTYAGAAFVLNDHWESMRDFDFVSNRIFDVLSCGGHLVSDYLASIPRLFGSAVTCVASEAEFREKVAKKLEPISIEDRGKVAEHIQTHHSFDARARTICNWVSEVLSVSNADQPAPEVPRAPTLGTTNRRKVGLLLQQGKAWPTSSAFIRLIAPLTTGAAYAHFDLVYLDSVDDPRIHTLDSCIVQRVAVPTIEEAERLVTRLQACEATLYVDTDDAFFLHEAHADHDKALRVLMMNAQEIWFSTAILASYYDDIATPKRVIPNALDPRLWRNYRTPVTTRFVQKPIRFIYMGTATHDEDFELVYPAFRRLAETLSTGQFQLTLIGAVRKPPEHNWLHRLQPPGVKGSYPEFTRWLMAQDRFDVGIAPLQSSKFNQAKSDIKFLDYSAMGLLSVVSDGPAYRNILTRELALGCKNDSDSWYATFEQIIKYPQDFVDMRKAAHRYVWTERSTMNDGNPMAALLAQ